MKDNSIYQCPKLSQVLTVAQVAWVPTFPNQITRSALAICLILPMHNGDKVSVA